MDRIEVEGGRTLHGEIPISGAKNAALPLMATAMLSDEPVRLANVPNLIDVTSMQRLLSNHGADVTFVGKSPGTADAHSSHLQIHAHDIVDTCAPYDLVSRMRASFWVIGPLLARCGEALVSLPGGCAIGTRPVNLYLEVMEQFGVGVEVEAGYVLARVSGRLRGTRIVLPFPSVGVTHVAVMLAVLASGETLIENAAREPEVASVCQLLRKMGAHIEGEGRSQIRVQGTDRLGAASHRVPPDRIEAGTYAMAVMMTGGQVALTGCLPGDLTRVFAILEGCGGEIEATETGVIVRRTGDILASDVHTAPYPGFPTDLQAQFMALMCHTKGHCRIRETIFENRFMHVQELIRLGADISLTGDTAHIRGVHRLTGAPVMATDLRASVSLVIAGLAAEGVTTIHRVYHLDRGFDRLEAKLTACGAKVCRVA